MKTIELTELEIEVIQCALCTYRIETMELSKNRKDNNPVVDMITRVELDFINKTK